MNNTRAAAALFKEIASLFEMFLSFGLSLLAAAPA